MANERLVLTIEPTESDADGLPTFSLDELNEHKGKFLGGGAFGKVYAINGFPGLAVKEVWLRGQQDRLVEITKFELEALSRFSHPGVLKYHQVIEDGDFFYVVMDRYSSDLDKFIAKYRKTHEPIPRELVLSIVRQLADALAYVHAPYKVNERGDVLPGIVHRDLKPANVLMSRDGERVAIADFGLCKDAQHDGNTFAGSPSYMAPEVFIHSKTSRASDIWALGVIIYELATLELPSFSHHWEPEKAKEFFVDGWRPDLSAIEDAFVRAILEKIFVLDPIERPTAGDIASLLQTPSTSANEPGAQNSLLDEKHEPRTALDDINSKASSSWTPLMRATAAGDIKAVRRHLSKKEKDNRKDMALIIAARAGYADIVELLDPTDERGITALMRAAERGDVEAVRALVPLQKGKTARYIKINGWLISHGTALMMAATRGHTEVVELLVEHEGNMQDSWGWTALMLTARNDHIDCIKLLLEKEACMQNKNGLTALMSAARNNRTDCVKLLLEKEGGMQDNDGWTALMWAARQGHKEVVEVLLEHEKGMKDKQGRTALYYAFKSGHMEVAEVIVPHEDPTNKDGVTALMRAAERNDVKAVKALIPLQKGQKTNNNDYAWSGRTALMRAAARGHTEVVRLLIEHEGGMQDRYDYTALMWAAHRGHTEVVRILVEYEGGMQNSWGWTALMFAANENRKDCIRVLLDKEGGMQRSNGWTALMYATYSNNLECARLLAEREKDIKTTRAWSGYPPGSTALDIAKERGHFEILSILSG